jgi:hypothetical protein
VAMVLSVVLIRASREDLPSGDALAAVA